MSDRILMIEDDDVSSWPMARVIQRLGDFRCPQGTVIPMKFSRRILKESESVNVEVVDAASMELAHETSGGTSRSKRMSTMDSVYSGVQTIATSEAELSALERVAVKDEVGGDLLAGTGVDDDGDDNFEREGKLMLSSDKSSFAVSDLVGTGNESHASTKISFTAMSREQIVQSDRVLKDVALSIVHMSSNDVADDVDELIKANPQKESLSIENCAAIGADVKSRVALVAGLASLTWADPSIQNEYVECIRMHVNNLALLNETLKGYEMKMKMSVRKKQPNLPGGPVAGGGKKTLFKQRVSVLASAVGGAPGADKE